MKYPSWSRTKLRRWDIHVRTRLEACRLPHLVFRDDDMEVDNPRIEFAGACLKLTFGEAQQLGVGREDPKVIDLGPTREDSQQ